VALILPSPLELQEYRNGVSDSDAIQRASDLFVIATGLKATTTEIEERLVRGAILEMAWAIGTRHEDLDAEFSPFSGEHIGSYSYSKAQKSVISGESTGVPSFDAAVAYFLAMAFNGGVSSTSSEWVFAKGFDKNSPLIGSHDPNFVFEGDLIPWPSSAPIITEDEPEIGIDEHGLYIEK
jgi:hypothetical protein